MLTTRMALASYALIFATMGCVVSARAADWGIRAIARTGSHVVAKRAAMSPYPPRPIMVAFQNELRPRVSAGPFCTISLGVVQGVGY